MSIADPRAIKRIVIFSIGTAAFAGQVYLPSVPDVQRDFDVSAAQVQLTVSIPIFTVAIGTLFWGLMSDRFGRRPTLLIGYVIFFAGTLLGFFASSVTLLTLARVVQAFGSAAGFVVSRAVVRDLFGRERAASELASLVAVMITVPMFAPLIGGTLTDYSGWRAVFGVLSVAIGGVALLLYFRFTETNKNPIPLPSVVSLFAAYGQLLRSTDFRAYACQGAMLVSSFNVFMAAAPYVVITVMGHSAKEYGLWFICQVVGYITGNLITNRFAQRVGVDGMISRALLLNLVCHIALVGVVLMHWWTPLAIFIPILGTGIANGMSLPNSNAGAMSVYPHLAGTAAGLLSFIQLGASALFAQAAGSFQNGTPYPMAAAMCFCAVMASIGFHLYKGPLRRADVPAE